MVLLKMDMDKFFHIIDESTNILKNELNISYLEAVAETGENLFERRVRQQLEAFTKKRLLKLYETINLDIMQKEDIRKAYQLAILKGMKEAIQPNHEMTPDAVCLFISYLVGKLMHSKQSFSLLDPAYGTGNLVTTVLNQTNKRMKAYGIEVDETLIKLAYVGANLQKHEVELFMQDALQPIFVENVDIVVSDLPVGYYPNDIVASGYELHTTNGEHSFSHYLFIEKNLRHLKDGGFLVAMIPNFMFEGEQASNFHTFIKENAIIVGLLQLPLSMFKRDKYAKSIFIIQKKGESVQEHSSQALLAELPSFSNKKAMRSMIHKIDSWFLSNFK